MSNLRIDNIAPSAGGTYRNAPRGIAAAWVNFNGTGTVAIRGSENVGSITDGGTGDYTANFTSNMSNGNYSVTSSLGGDTNNNEVRMPYNGGSFDVGSVTFTTLLVGVSINDSTYVCLSIHGDLA